MNFEKDKIYDTCQPGKQTRSSFKSKNIVLTFRPLKLIHMDFFGPNKTTNLGGKRYILVIVDNFSWFI